MMTALEPDVKLKDALLSGHSEAPHEALRNPKPHHRRTGRLHSADRHRQRPRHSDSSPHLHCCRKLKHEKKVLAHQVEFLVQERTRLQTACEELRAYANEQAAERQRLQQELEALRTPDERVAFSKDLVQVVHLPSRDSPYELSKVSDLHEEAFKDTTAYLKVEGRPELTVHVSSPPMHDLFRKGREVQPK